MFAEGVSAEVMQSARQAKSLGWVARHLRNTMETLRRLNDSETKRAN